jgi:hypothetical protein
MGLIPATGIRTDLIIESGTIAKNQISVTQQQADYNTNIKAGGVFLVAVHGWSSYDDGGGFVYLTSQDGHQTTPNTNPLLKQELWSYGSTYAKNNFDLFLGSDGNFHVNSKKAGGNYANYRVTFVKLCGNQNGA